jgi:surface protein
MANSINWGKIYESTYWGSGVADNTINWGKSYRDLAGDPAPFITEWRTDTSPQTITIPIQTTNTYTITTSDGQEITTSGYDPQITFPTAGTYEVSISGDIQQISFSITNTSKDYIYDVKQWGTDTTWTSFVSAFLNCFNLNVTASDTPIIGATSMRTAFTSCRNLTGTPAFNNWDVSNVIVMAGMFRNTSFNQGIGNWNVSSVASMDSMFRASNFNQDIGNWNVSSVANMGSMFQDNTVFDQDISNWDISNVTDFIDFLNIGTLSTSNYDALLIGWYSTLKAIYVDPASPPSYPGDGLSIHFGNSVSSSAGSASRAALQQSPFNWTIADGTP